VGHADALASVDLTALAEAVTVSVLLIFGDASRRGRARPPES
jgi:hypothetical protein